MSNEEKVSHEYKIRHKITGLYQNGGSMVVWSKKGKTWSTKSALSNHFNLIKSSGMYRCLNANENYNDWEIEIVVVKREHAETISVNTFLESKKSRNKK